MVGMWGRREWGEWLFGLLVVVGVTVFYMAYVHVLPTVLLWAGVGMVLTGGAAFLYVVYRRLMGGVDSLRH